jgi:hypothetical protein
MQQQKTGVAGSSGGRPKLNYLFEKALSEPQRFTMGDMAHLSDVLSALGFEVQAQQIADRAIQIEQVCLAGAAGTSPQAQLMAAYMCDRKRFVFTGQFGLESQLSGAGDAAIVLNPILNEPDPQSLLPPQVPAPAPGQIAEPAPLSPVNVPPSGPVTPGAPQQGTGGPVTPGNAAAPLAPVQSDTGIGGGLARAAQRRAQGQAAQADAVARAADRGEGIGQALAAKAQRMRDAANKMAAAQGRGGAVGEGAARQSQLRQLFTQES